MYLTLFDAILDATEIENNFGAMSVAVVASPTKKFCSG
jgi:hypothetical protein